MARPLVVAAPRGGKPLPRKRRAVARRSPEDAAGSVRPMETLPAVPARKEQRMILWHNLQQEQRDEHFKNFEAESSSDKIHCLLLYEDQHSGVESLAQDEVFWNEHRVLTNGHCICIGVKDPAPVAQTAGKQCGAATRLIGLFGCAPHDLPCLVICQMLRWSNAMRHMVVPLAHHPNNNDGRPDTQLLLQRVAKEMHNMLAGHFPDGYFLYTGIEYSLGELTSKRGLVAAQAVWNHLKQAS